MVRTVNRSSPVTGVFHVSVDVDYLIGTEGHARQLVDGLARRGVSPSVFVAGQMAESMGADLRRWANDGCEIGIHGWAHCQDPNEDFRALSRADQVELLMRASEVVETAVGSRPTMFRAPNLWISDDIAATLRSVGIAVDSSVPSGRCDLVIGRIRTLRYLRAPRQPYELSPECCIRPGHSGVMEVPVLSALIPINMMALRAFGPGLLSALSIAIARSSGYVLFYCHPAEIADRRLGSTAQVPRRHRYRSGSRASELLDNYLDRLSAAGLRSASINEIIRASGAAS